MLGIITLCKVWKIALLAFPPSALFARWPVHPLRRQSQVSGRGFSMQRRVELTAFSTGRFSDSHPIAKIRAIRLRSCPISVESNERKTML